MAINAVNGDDDGATLCAAAEAATGERQWRWGWRHVKWRLVLRAQHWGALFLIAPAVVVIAVSHFSFQKAPRVRPAFLYDATISYPIIEGVAVPDSLAALYPWLAFLGVLVVVEAGLFWGRHSASTAAAAALHFCLACFTNFLIVLAVAEATKPWAGRLRPDFLHRCRPAALGPIEPGGTATAADRGGGLPVGTLTVFEEAAECTNPHLAEVNDGRLSFPSGHACNTMSVAWFAGLYMIWSLHIREGSPCLAHHVQAIRRQGPWWGRVLREALNAFAFGYIIFSVCLGWFIGINRLWDNRHHMSDILGGFLLAAMLGTFHAVKAIGQYAIIKAQLDGASSAQQQRPLLPVSGAAGAAPAHCPALPANGGGAAAHAPAVGPGSYGGGSGGGGGDAGEVALQALAVGGGAGPAFVAGAPAGDSDA